VPLSASHEYPLDVLFLFLVFYMLERQEVAVSNSPACTSKAPSEPKLEGEAVEKAAWSVEVPRGTALFRWGLARGEPVRDPIDCLCRGPSAFALIEHMVGRVPLSGESSSRRSLE